MECIFNKLLSNSQFFLPDCCCFYSTSHGADQISCQYLIFGVELQLRDIVLWRALVSLVHVCLTISFLQRQQ